MGEFDAAGEIVTGALLGRTVEQGGAGAHAAGAICLNCGTALIGPHCHACGQSGHVHRSLGAIGHEILHGVAHFEGKIWRTLPLLIWRPGELTRRYIAGERARFVSPMALFLFSIFAMFAAFSWAGIGPPTDMRGGSGSATAAIRAEREEVTEAQKKVAAALPQADAERRADLEETITELDAKARALDAVAAQLKATDDDVEVVNTGFKAFDYGIEKWRKNPSLMIYKMQSSGYKFSWLLIPLSLPFVWLLFFWKRQYKLYDHTVFITYSIAFMSLLFIVVTVAAALHAPTGAIVLAALAVPFVHVTRQLKQAYRLRWRSAIARAVVLTFFIEIVLTLFVAILFLLGITG